ncbi:sugar ABC transporter ATP-binding protein [Candidatus Sumerlaeota bacterium]
MSEPLLEMRGIDKSFPGVRALSAVDFRVRPGEVQALMGENGAGKSTLIKVLTGVYPRDAGEIFFEGRAVNPGSPKEAEGLGISTVYQEVNLIPHLSVAENIALGRQPKRFGFLNWSAIRRRAEQALARLDVQLDVTREVASCSVAIQQMVAIARALDIKARLLVLDEPTSSLDEHEVAELFTILRKLREEGMGIVFITHFLDQVYEIADCITVLRNGELVGEYPTSELPRLALIGKMLGKEPQEVEAMRESGARTEETAERQVIIRAQGLGRRGAVEPLDMELAEGQVLGLAGLLGSGRTETARLLFGIDRKDTGRIELDGQKVSLNSPRKAISRGLAFCSEDRKTEGIIPGLSVRENIVLAMQASRGVLRTLSRQEQLRIADRFIKALNIKTPSPETPMASLSGGNQQKVLLARWLAMEPRLIILDEPTRGIDVGAKAEIEKLIADLRAGGMSVLFISSELEEVVRDCQRVIVLRDRKKIGELHGDEIDENRIMGMIAKSA